MDDTNLGSLRTANYSGSNQRMLTGLEHLMDGSSVLPFHIADYWQWAYSDMLRNTQRGVFAEFIVKAALDLGGIFTNNNIRSNFEPFDLVGPNITHRSTPPRLENSSFPCRIEVKSAAYIQSWNPHPGSTPRISFSIAPAKVPDEIGDYRPDAPMQRNSDVYVFTVYTAKERERNILDMNLWEFYVAKTSALDEKYGNQKTVSLTNLVRDLSLTAVPFSGLCRAIVDACESISDDNKKDHPAPDSPAR